MLIALPFVVLTVVTPQNPGLSPHTMGVADTALPVPIVRYCIATNVGASEWAVPGSQDESYAHPMPCAPVNHWQLPYQKGRAVLFCTSSWTCKRSGKIEPADCSSPPLHARIVVRHNSGLGALLPTLVCDSDCILIHSIIDNRYNLQYLPEDSGRTCKMASFWRVIQILTQGGLKIHGKPYIDLYLCVHI